MARRQGGAAVSPTEHRIELEYDGKAYVADVEIEWVKIDDSFDGHLYGRSHTFEDHHFEAESIEVMGVIDVDIDEYVQDLDLIEGLESEIILLARSTIECPYD